MHNLVILKCKFDTFTSSRAAAKVMEEDFRMPGLYKKVQNEKKKIVLINTLEKRKLFE